MDERFKKRSHDDVDKNDSQDDCHGGLTLGFLKTPPSGSQTPGVASGKLDGAHDLADIFGYAHHSLGFGVYRNV